jgi:hypothetical protein
MKIATTAAYIPSVGVAAIVVPLSDAARRDPAEAQVQASRAAFLLRDKKFGESLLGLAKDAFATVSGMVAPPTQSDPSQDPLYAIATDARDLATAVSVGDTFDIRLGTVTLVADIVQQFTQYVQGASIVVSFIKVGMSGIVALQRSNEGTAHEPVADQLREGVLRKYTAQYVAPKKRADELTFRSVQLPEIPANAYMAEQLGRIKRTK